MNVYNSRLDEITAAAGQLIAISPQVPDSTLSLKEKNDLKFEVLSDEGYLVSEKYGLVYTLPEYIAKHMTKMIDMPAYYNDQSNRMPLTPTYVIDSEGIIQYAFISADYTKRAEPEELIEALRDL